MTVLVIDNIFSDRQFELMSNEIRSLTGKILPFYIGDSIQHRLSLDVEYQNRFRYESSILNNIGQMFDNPKLHKEWEKLDEYSYYRLGFDYSFKTFITQLRDSTAPAYPWHREMTPSSLNAFMTFIIYMNGHEDFNEGELKYKEDGVTHTVIPEKNRLVMIPSHVEHMVTDPIYDKDNKWRTTINGVVNGTNR